MVGKRKGSHGKPLILASMVVKKKCSQGMKRKDQAETTIPKNKRKRAVVDDDDDFQNPSSVNEEQANKDSGNRDQASASFNVLTKGLIRKKMQGERGVSREDVVGASNKPSDDITQSVESIDNRVVTDLTSRRGRKQKVVEFVIIDNIAGDANITQQYGNLPNVLKKNST